MFGFVFFTNLLEYRSTFNTIWEVLFTFDSNFYNARRPRVLALPLVQNRANFLIPPPPEAVRTLCMAPNTFNK